MGCRAHLCHLPGLDQVGHSPRGTSGSAGTLDWGPMWSDSLFSCCQLSDQPKAWQVDILSHGWLAGQLQLASWLAGWLPIEQNVNLTLPPGRAMCVTTLVTQTCGQMYPPVDISWPIENPLWPPHETLGQVGIWSDVRSGQHHVRPPLPLKKSSGQGKMIDPLDNFYTTNDLLPGRVTI